MNDIVSQTCLLVLLAISSKIIVVSASTEADGMFTSSADLERLLSTEAELVRALKDYVQLEEDRLTKLKNVMTIYDKVSQEATSDVERYIGNPLNSFLLIKRLTSDWKELKHLIKDEDIFTNLTDNFQRPLKWPSEEDLSGAAQALTRLQETYNLDPTDLTHGKLQGVNYGTTLSAHDCFELGRQHYNAGDYDHSIVWMKEALKRLDEEEDLKTASRSDIIEYIAFSFYTLGDLKKALTFTNELIAIQPDHPRAPGNKFYYETKLTESGESLEDKIQKKGEDGQSNAEPEFSVSERNLIENAQSEYSTYKKLCRGEKTKPNTHEKDLQCRYCHGFHPYLKIAPYKEEELFLNPRIVLYHDVLTESEFNTVKSFAIPRFRRATVQNYKTGELETASYRISKTAWIKRDEDEHIESIYQRVGDVTGLNMETSEELQVSNYGIGGHYEPHFDFARKEEANAFTSLGTGNRIATWLFYVSFFSLE